MGRAWLGWLHPMDFLSQEFDHIMATLFIINLQLFSHCHSSFKERRHDLMIVLVRFDLHIQFNQRERTKG